MAGKGRWARSSTTSSPPVVHDDGKRRMLIKTLLKSRALPEIDARRSARVLFTRTPSSQPGPAPAQFGRVAAPSVLEAARLGPLHPVLVCWLGWISGAARPAALIRNCRPAAEPVGPAPVFLEVNSAALTTHDTARGRQRAAVAALAAYVASTNMSARPVPGRRGHFCLARFVEGHTVTFPSPRSGDRTDGRRMFALR